MEAQPSGTMALSPEMQRFAARWTLKQVQGDGVGFIRVTVLDYQGDGVGFIRVTVLDIFRVTVNLEFDQKPNRN